MEQIRIFITGLWIALAVYGLVQTHWLVNDTNADKDAAAKAGKNGAWRRLFGIRMLVAKVFAISLFAALFLGFTGLQQVVQAGSMANVPYTLQEVIMTGLFYTMLLSVVYACRKLRREWSRWLEEVQARLK